MIPPRTCRRHDPCVVAVVMSESKARRTKDAITSYLESGIIAMPEGQVRELQNSLRDFKRTGVDTFEEHFRQDLFLVLRIFERASRLSPDGTKNGVGSVTEAIQLIGVDRFQDILTGISRNRAVQNPNQEVLLNEAVDEALLTGMLTKTLAEDMGVESSKECVLAGQMQQIGRVLAAAAMPFEFQKCQSMAKRYGNEDAERKVFGLTFQELTNQILNRSCLPREVLTKLKDVAKAEDDESSISPDAECSILVAARETSELLSSPDLSWESFETGISKILPKLPRNVTFNRSDFIRSLGRASEAMDEVRGSDSRSSTDERSPLVSRINIISHGKNAAFPPMERSAVIPIACIDGSDEEFSDVLIPVDNVNGDESGTGRGKRQKSGLEAASHVFSVIKDFSDFDVDSLSEFLAWSHTKSLKLRNCIVLLPNQNRNELKTGYIEGKRFADSQRDMVVNLNERTIFNPVVRTGKDLILRSRDVEKMRPYLPRWLAPEVAQKNCSLLPVMHDGNLCAILVCVGDELAAFNGDNTLISQSRSLRQLMAAVWDEKNIDELKIPA